MKSTHSFVFASIYTLMCAITFVLASERTDSQDSFMDNANPNTSDEDLFKFFKSEVEKIVKEYRAETDKSINFFEEERRKYLDCFEETKRNNPRGLLLLKKVTIMICKNDVLDNHISKNLAVNRIKDLVKRAFSSPLRGQKNQLMSLDISADLDQIEEALDQKYNEVTKFIEEMK